jgi:flagellar protein FliS
MFGAMQKGASAYARVGIETGVVAASPHRLISMLFEGALIALSSAVQQMKAGSTAAKGQSISKAINIIDNGLRASLDKKVGGEIALSLDALYEYMSKRLLTANSTNQPDMVDEVQGLLRQLKSAWDAIGPTVAEQATGAEPASALPRVAEATMSAQARAFASLAPQPAKLKNA